MKLLIYNRRGWGLLARIIITASVLVFLGVKLDWAKVARLLLQSEPTSLFIACLILGATFIVGSMRWWLLLKVQAIDLPLILVSKLTFVGLFFNLFLLGAVGGDVFKAGYIMKYSPEKMARATLSIIMDRALGMIVFFVAFFAAIFWQFHFLVQREETRTIALAFAVVFMIGVLTVIGVVVIPFHRAPIIIKNLWQQVPYRHTAGSLRDGLKQHGQALKYTLGAFGLSIIAVMMVALAGCWIAASIHIAISYLQMIVILAFVVGITSLPTSVAGHGVREGAFILMFTVFGIGATVIGGATGKELAVTFSLIFFALHLFWGLVGGVLYLGFGQISNLD